jgi:hypothetical protein
MPKAVTAGFIDSAVLAPRQKWGQPVLCLQDCRPKRFKARFCRFDAQTEPNLTREDLSNAGQSYKVWYAELVHRMWLCSQILLCRHAIKVVLRERAFYQPIHVKNRRILCGLSLLHSNKHTVCR